LGNPLLDICVSVRRSIAEARRGIPMSDNGQSQAPSRNDKRIFTTGEAAAICKVSQQTIIRCFDSGRLTGFRVPGSKFRRIPREELIRFMKANGIPLEALEGSSKRVLVVDDDPAIVDTLVQVLTRDGRWEVKTATTGYDAGMLTESFRPSVMLLDYLLPDINGNLVCQRVKTTPHLQDTKIIIVSGVVNQSEVQGLLDSGADDFVKKPFNVAQLLSKMAHLSGLDSASASRF
jgi:excisionase family DNA binding protein